MNRRMEDGVRQKSLSSKHSVLTGSEEPEKSVQHHNISQYSSTLSQLQGGGHPGRLSGLELNPVKDVFQLPNAEKRSQGSVPGRRNKVQQ